MRREGFVLCLDSCLSVSGATSKDTTMNNAKRKILVTLAATLCTAMYAAPLSLDISSLSNAWNEAGVSSYKCKSAFRDFGKGIADANAESIAKRTKLDATARVYLKQQLEKAQAEGDFDKVLIFKTALESARDGEIVAQPAQFEAVSAKQKSLRNRWTSQAGKANWWSISDLK